MNRMLVSIFAGAILFTGSVYSDMYLVQKTHTDQYTVAGMTVPAKDEQSTIWFSPDKICTNKGNDTTLLMRLDKKMMYTIDKKSKKYSELSLDELQKRLDQVKGEMDKAAAENQAAAQMMMGMLKVSANVTETTESKMIGKWNSKKYLVNQTMAMMSTVTEMWTSQDIKVDYPLYNKLRNGFLTSIPGYAEIIKEHSKVKGFPVMSKTTSTVMGSEIVSTEELIEASEKAAPAGVYEIPAGYKKDK